jgi:hypothetical protein
MLLQNYNLLFFGVTKPGLQNLLHGLLGSVAVRLTDNIYPNQRDKTARNFAITITAAILG